MKPNLYRLSIHALKSHSENGTFTTDGLQIRICQDVELYSQFDIKLDSFAQQLIAKLDATYEYDGSFAFFLGGEPISGTLVGADDYLSVVELFDCTQAATLQQVLDLFQETELVIQIVELGVFVSPEELIRILG